MKSKVATRLKTNPQKTPSSSDIYTRISRILESARTHVARSVNTTQVIANWLIGREIVEEEQQGRERAEYGKKLIESLSVRLQKQFGVGYSIQNLWYIRQFYQEYPHLLEGKKILRALSGEFRNADAETCQKIHSVRGESWQPGKLNVNVSWTHYRHLLRVEKKESRSFYEIELVKNNWTSRELERQINSLLYERLALSKDKKGVMRLAKKGQEIQKPIDVFKEPVVIEFLKLPESPKLVETDIETGLISNLQSFLLEMGKGFSFLSRQERITLDGDHFYVDLVFYHTILKCYVLIDIKTGKLTHQDLGQMQLYVNYFDQEKRRQDDNPTLGLILCTDKNDAVVRYTLGPKQKKIFARRYQLYLPTVAELKKEIRRELKLLGA